MSGRTRRSVDAMRGRLLFLACALVLMLPRLPAQPMATGQPKFAGNVIRNGMSIRSDFAGYWNQVTAENAGKWGSVEGSQGVYNWTELDNIYNYAVSNGYPYRHHTLVWGQQQPTFLSSLDSATQYQEIVNWFSESGTRYLSASFCDVVNEPLHAPPSYKNALGGDGATGWDWVIRAFQLARQYWPFQKLHINEYGIINDGAANAQYLQIINLLKTRGLIDGIGVQGHRFELENASANTLRTNLNNLAATGLPIYITELDLGNLGNSGTPNDSVQLALYQQKFTVLWEHTGVRGLTLWGYAQNEIWQTTAYLRRSNGTERPALQWLHRYLATPLPPSLLSPLGSIGEPRNPILRWTRSALAGSYRFQVSTNVGFSAIVADSIVADTVCRVPPLTENTLHFWRVSAINDSGESAFSTAGNFTTGDQIVGVKENGNAPVAFVVRQNFPNPFNAATRIEFATAVRMELRFVLVSALGQVIRELGRGSYDPGTHGIALDLSDCAAGTYFLRVEAGGDVAVRKILLVK